MTESATTPVSQHSRRSPLSIRTSALILRHLCSLVLVIPTGTRSARVAHPCLCPQMIRTAPYFPASMGQPRNACRRDFRAELPFFHQRNPRQKKIHQTRRRVSCRNVLRLYYGGVLCFRQRNPRQKKTHLTCRRASSVNVLRPSHK